MSLGELRSPAEVTLVISAGLITLTFLLSGLGKIFNPNPTLQSMQQLDIPTMFRRASLIRALALAEIGLPIPMLIAEFTVSRIATLGLAGLLIFFLVFQIRAIFRQKDSYCNCFGPFLPPMKVGLGTVIRNVFLFLICTVIFAFHPTEESLLGLVEKVEPTQLFLSLVVLLLLLICYAQFMWKGNRNPKTADREVSSNINGFKNSRVDPRQDFIGTQIPPTEVVSGDGMTIQIARLGRGRATLAIFLSAECSSCKPVLSKIPEWSVILDSIVVRGITSSRKDEIARLAPESEKFMRFGAKSTLEALGITGLPAAVLLGSYREPVVASGIAYGYDEIEALVNFIAANR